MKTTQTTGQPLDDLAATAVRFGRELARMAQAVHLGGTSKEHGYVSRTLRRLAERDPFDPRDEAALMGLLDIIKDDLQSEVTCTEKRFFESHCDDDGQHGEVRECPVYTARGEELLHVQQIFSRFIAAHDATLDRIAAERALLRLLAV